MTKMLKIIKNYLVEIRYLPSKIKRLPGLIKAMYPRARKYGWRYFWDENFRRIMRQREDGKKLRQRKGSGFLSRIRKIKLNLMARNGAKCSHCKHQFPKDKLTVDHIIRTRDGGGNDYKNLQLLCRPCHDLKDFKGYETPSKEELPKYTLSNFNKPFEVLKDMFPPSLHK